MLTFATTRLVTAVQAFVDKTVLLAEKVLRAHGAAEAPSVRMPTHVALERIDA